jgi:hypothetical protein
MATYFLIMMPIGAFLIFWAAFLRRAYANVPLKKSPLYPGQIVPQAARDGGLHLDPVVRRRPLGASGTPTRCRSGKPRAEAGRPEGDARTQAVRAAFPVAAGASSSARSSSASAARWRFMALRRRRDGARAGSRSRDARRGARETLDDLRSEPDPRKAVIGAYAKMERTLAARGFPRDESEAPLEYLGRILGIVEGSGHSARRLTRLFERAGSARTRSTRR